MAPPTTRMSPWERRLVIAADRFIYWLTAHWLFLCCLAAFVVLAGAYASPYLMAHGHERLGSLIFRVYHRFCHQYPERSFFAFGHQVAFCQRDVGMYLGIIGGGVLYSLSRRQLALRSIGWYAIIFVLPMAVDGLTQLFGLRQSNWYLRLSTGLWFGIGTALVAYPALGRAMADARAELEGRFGRGIERLGRPKPPAAEEGTDGCS